jgi:hypothetical protein
MSFDLGVRQDGRQAFARGLADLGFELVSSAAQLTTSTR